MARSSCFSWSRLAAATAVATAGVVSVVAASEFRPSPALALPSTDCTSTEPSTANGVVLVATPGHLKWLATNTVSLGATVEQQNDLDLAACGNWPGIGDAGSNPFTGTYDGNDHTISNVNIAATTDHQGLFRLTVGATLSALTLDGVTVAAANQSQVGGLVGEARNSMITSVTVLGANISGFLTTGGLVGKGDGGSITNSSAAGTVTATSNFAGGLVGQNSGPISDSHSTADVTGTRYAGGLVGHQNSRHPITNSYATGDLAGINLVGGLVGESRGTIERSFATGDLTGNPGNSFGGLVGESYGPIDNSYATGDVTGRNYTGGLVGYQELRNSGDDITHSYSAGTVIGGVYLGGLVGDNEGAFIIDSFWDTETSAMSTSDGGSGSTSALMKTFSTFDAAGWSITNGDADPNEVWGICDGVTYPFLMWQTQLPVGAPGRTVCVADPGPTPVGGATLPPGISELVDRPVATSTTTVTPSTTTTTTPTPPTTTVPSDGTPPPVLVDGALPELGAGEVEVFEDGRPVIVEATAVGTELVLQASTFELRLERDCANGCTVDDTADGRQVLTLEQQGLATLKGEGFQASSAVYVWLFSEPLFLGQITVNADGNFSGDVALGNITPGVHTLQVNGTSADGQPRTANIGVIVSAGALPTPVPGALPATGTDGTPIWLIALALLGMGLVAITRRRTA